ncbi:calpain-10 isoform X3 [Rhinolophus sinicus]|uniref:calpain-10 isoform X3 n=1 Tax=Rhinolophus sinicus TaxID=89399 RepID=UPI003D79733B
MPCPARLTPDCLDPASRAGKALPGPSHSPGPQDTTSHLQTCHLPQTALHSPSEARLPLAAPTKAAPKPRAGRRGAFWEAALHAGTRGPRPTSAEVASPVPLVSRTRESKRHRRPSPNHTGSRTRRPSASQRRISAGTVLGPAGPEGEVLLGRCFSLARVQLGSHAPRGGGYRGDRTDGAGAQGSLRFSPGWRPGWNWEHRAGRKAAADSPSPSGAALALAPGSCCPWEPGSPKMRAPARELFRDAAFPASSSSLFSSFSTPLAQFREDITWRRPQEICATPRLFPDNPQEGQVKQGLLGDCWFLCACAALQKSRHLLEQVSATVIPPGQPSWLDQTYRGSFTCRVWQFGHWVEVTIDDRLPCLAGRLCFSRCQREDVFWLPLLEKVYAKVYGSYEHLWAGQVAEALVDLTGGLAERWNLKDLAQSSGQQDRPGDSEPRTCRHLLGLKQRCLISCSVFSPRADLRELQTPAGPSLLLLCIQNPWGRRCWQGPWREGGEGWSRVEAADQSELLSQLQEGEFWVEEEEFLREFDEVTIGYPVTETGHLQSLYSEKLLCHTQALPGAWVKGQSAGGCRNNSDFPSNPKFWLRVWEPSEVCAAVLQRPRVRTSDWAGRARAPAGDDRTAWSPAHTPGQDYPAVGLHLWKVEKRRVSLPRLLSTPPVAGTVCHAYDREVHLRCELAPGYYLAVPSTFLKDVPGQFLLRVFSSGRVSLSAIKPVAEVPDPEGEWETVQLRGSWRIGQTAGGSRNFASYPTNPCLPLSVPGGAGPRCVRITLRQHCPHSDCHPIGFHVFQVPADGGGQGTASLLLQKPLLSCVPHCYAQEVSRLCHLSAGTYRVVPSTYLPDTEGSFTVTIATRIDRRSIHSQERLGQLLQEASFLAVMKT